MQSHYPYATLAGQYNKDGSQSVPTQSLSKSKAHHAHTAEGSRTLSTTVTTPSSVISRQPLRANRMQSAGNSPAMYSYSRVGDRSTPPLVPLGSSYATEDGRRAKSSGRPQAINDGVMGVAPGVRQSMPQSPASAFARLGEQQVSGFDSASAAPDARPQLASTNSGHVGDGGYDAFYAAGGAASYPRGSSFAPWNGYAVPHQQIADAPQFSATARPLPGIIKTLVGQNNGCKGYGTRSADAWVLAQQGPLPSPEPCSSAETVHRVHSSPTTGNNRTVGTRTSHAKKPPAAVELQNYTATPGNTPVPASSGKSGKRTPHPAPASTANMMKQPQQRPPANGANLPWEPHQQPLPQQTPPRIKGQSVRSGGGRVVVAAASSPVPNILQLPSSYAYLRTPPPQSLDDSIATALSVHRAQPQTRSEKAAGSVADAPATPRNGTTTTPNPSDNALATSVKKKKTHPPSKSTTPTRFVERSPSLFFELDDVNSSGHTLICAPSNASESSVTVEKVARVNDDKGRHRTHRRRESNKTGKHPKKRRHDLVSPASLSDDSQSDSTLTHTSVSEGRREGVDFSEEEAVDPHHLGCLAKPTRTRGCDDMGRSATPTPSPLMEDTPSHWREKRREPVAGVQVDQPPHLSATIVGGGEVNHAHQRELPSHAGAGSGADTPVAVVPATTPPPPLLAYTRINSGSFHNNSPSVSNNAGNSMQTPLSGSAIRRGSERAAVPPCSPESKGSDQGPASLRQCSAGTATVSSLSAHCTFALEGGLRPTFVEVASPPPVDKAASAAPLSQPDTATASMQDDVLAASPTKGASVSAGTTNGTAAPKEKKGRLSAGIRGGGVEGRRSGSVGASHRQRSPQPQQHASVNSSSQRTPMNMRRSFHNGPSAPNCLLATAAANNNSSSNVAPTITAGVRPWALLPGSATPSQSQLMNAEYTKSVRDQRRKEFYAWNELSRKKAEGDENAV